MSDTFEEAMDLVIEEAAGSFVMKRLLIDAMLLRMAALLSSRPSMPDGRNQDYTDLTAAAEELQKWISAFKNGEFII